jgi:hypothetical protein
MVQSSLPMLNSAQKRYGQVSSPVSVSYECFLSSRANFVHIQEPSQQPFCEIEQFLQSCPGPKDLFLHTRNALLHWVRFYPSDSAPHTARVLVRNVIHMKLAPKSILYPNFYADAITVQSWLLHISHHGCIDDTLVLIFFADFTQCPSRPQQR